MSENDKNPEVTNWDFILECDRYAKRHSHDQTTKVGAILLSKAGISIGQGSNRFPDGCDIQKLERHERPSKYDWFAHAEENAIMDAAKYGYATNGGSMYVNWFPCARCAGMIINAGIKKVYYKIEPDFERPGFGESFKIAVEKFKEAKVKLIFVENGDK